MSDSNFNDRDDIYSEMMRAGRRTYFFDVRETRAGDYYLTITESKKFSSEDGSFHFKKHKIYLYKEDFADFKEHMTNAMDFIIKEKGETVISERHQDDYVKPEKQEDADGADDKSAEDENFTDVNFDEL